MRFSLVVNLDRFDERADMRDVAAQRLELVQIADAGGFDIVWTAEHHTIETTIAPNPFILLTYWGQHTKRIRLGTAVVSAPYWHPIRLAGEAALTDILLAGRLEIGLGRGAYQYEFDRMANGMDQREGGRHLREIVPLLKELWRGDVEHRGESWSFPRATAVPKPLQKPHPPLWIAARDPATFDFAIKHGCNVMSTPLRRPRAEVFALCARFEDAVRANPDAPRPEHMMMRLACVYEGASDWEVPAEAAIRFGGRFENLFRNLGAVNNGFPEPADYAAVSGREDYAPAKLRENMMFGTPDEVAAKLADYEEAGVDHFLYGACFGLPHDIAIKSLKLFCAEVMPRLAERKRGAPR